MKFSLKTFFKWAVTAKTPLFPHKAFTEAVLFAVRSKGLLPVPAHSLAKSKGVIQMYEDPPRAAVVALVNQVKAEVPCLLTANEAYQLFKAVQQSLKIPGELVEVGVFGGGSAKLICEAKGERPLSLFDTFEGLPAVQDIDRSRFEKNQFTAPLEQVKSYLKKYPNVSFYLGIFPGTSDPIKDKRFCFVNLDVDTYESTQACLNFFYPRMNPGGIILCDDYNYAPGVMKSVDAFFKNKPEPIIEMLGSQCVIVKLTMPTVKNES